jgi:hypothetical protein
VKAPRKGAASPINKLESLDLSMLSEEERQSAIAEVRALISEMSSDKRSDAPVLERKLALLRLWQRLVQLRIADVKEEKTPPEVKPAVVRMFPPDPEPEPVEAPAPEAAPAPAPAQKRKTSSQVSVKLSEEAVIKGKTHAADSVVQVSRKEADGLVEAGKAVVVDETAKSSAQEDAAESAAS